MSPLTARTLAATRDLSLVARRLVEGAGFGAHRSRTPGPGLEFTQYRPYQPGDDLRRLDWKLAARADRWFIRESERETSVPLRLVVDATASMGYAEDGVSLLDLARMLAAALALVAVRQGDAIGLVAARDERPVLLPARRDRAQLERVLHALERLEPAGRWPAWRALEAAVAVGGRGITVVLTDAAEAHEEIAQALRRLVALRHDVVLLHLGGPALAAFPWSGPVRFEELETGRVLEADATLARAAWQARTAARGAELERLVRGLGAEYRQVTLDAPLDAVLRDWLRARARAG